MPEIQIRPAIESDIPTLMGFDHSFSSEHAWQMELHIEANQMGAIFREIHLPRLVRVDYPRSSQTLTVDWRQRSALLVAVLGGETVGYATLMQNLAPRTTWTTDLVVTRHLRRQGFGSALVLAAMEWAAEHGESRRLLLEMQPKNHPAICLAMKLGFDFSGYNDNYYTNGDTAILFSKWLR